MRSILVILSLSTLLAISLCSQKLRNYDENEHELGLQDVTAFLPDSIKPMAQKLFGKGQSSSSGGFLSGLFGSGSKSADSATTKPSSGSGGFLSGLFGGSSSSPQAQPSSGGMLSGLRSLFGGSGPQSKGLFG